jgi:hypothetical protein
MAVILIHAQFIWSDQLSIDLEAWDHASPKERNHLVQQAVVEALQDTIDISGVRTIHEDAIKWEEIAGPEEEEQE